MSTNKIPKMISNTRRNFMGYLAPSIYKTYFVYLISHDRPVSIRAAVTEQLPGIAPFADLVQVEIGDDQFVLVAAAFGNYLAARIAEIALPVKLADVPRRSEGQTSELQS